MVSPRSSFTTVFYLLIATCLILTPVLTPIANGHEVETDPYRIFFSDDSDEGSSSGDVADYSLEDFEQSDTSAGSIGARADYTFDNADPIVVFEDTVLDFSEWRASQVPKPSFSRYSTRAPIYTCVPTGHFTIPPSDEDGEYNPEQAGLGGQQTHPCSGTQEPARESWSSDPMKDAHVTIYGIEDAVEMNHRRMVQGASVDSIFDPGFVPPSERHVRAIPPQGDIYLHADFRLDPEELDNQYCNAPEWEYEGNELVDGERTCIEQSFYDEDASHKAILTGGNSTEENVIGESSDNDLAGDTITYNAAVRDEDESLFIQSQLNYTVEKTTIEEDWDPDHGWEEESQSTEYELNTNEHRSRALRVSTTRNKELNVGQTVINIDGYDQTYLVVTMEGPQNADNGVEAYEGRRLWTRMYLGACTEGRFRTCDQNQYVESPVEVYSSRQFEHVKITRSDETETIHKPDERFPALRMITGNPEPRLRVNDTDKTLSRANIQSSQTERIYKVSSIPRDTGGLISNGHQAPVTKENVAIPQSPPTIVTQMTIKNAPGPVNRVEDVHGDRISIDPENTKTARGLVPEIYFEEKDNMDVEITVRDPGVGKEPLPNRRLSIEGAEENVVYTDENGAVTVSRTKATLRVQSTADDFTEEQSVYYVSAINSKSYYTNPIVIQYFLDFLYQSLYALPFIGFYMWLKYMRDTDDV